LLQKSRPRDRSDLSVPPSYFWARAVAPSRIRTIGGARSWPQRGESPIAASFPGSESLPWLWPRNGPVPFSFGTPISQN